MADNCPLCGTPVRQERIYYDKTARAVIGNGHVRQLTPKQARLFELLWPPSPSYMMAAKLADAMGENFYRPDAGTVPAIASMAKALRKILRPLNIHVEGLRARDRGGYRIVVPRPEQQKRAA